MREVRRSAIVPYAADAMFALVADVESYPRFVPGCIGSAVLSRDPAGVVARIELSKGPFHAGFTTRNALEPPRRLGMELVEGPFKSLDGEWLFTPLSDAPEAPGCRIELHVKFQFAGVAGDLLLGPAFELTCTSLVDAFVHRARAVYG